MKEDEGGDLPLRDKLLVLSAPYRSPLSQKEFLKTIYSCFFYPPIIINTEPMILVCPKFHFIFIQAAQFTSILVL